VFKQTGPSCLSIFAGEWAGEEAIAPSKWGPGGSAAAIISARLDLNERILIQDYSAERDGKPWLKAHAIFVFEEQSAAYSLFWFDSLGFIPRQAAQGQWDGAEWTFIRESPRGRTRHIYSLKNSDRYRLKLESSFDEGATWTPVMEGNYFRVK